jgi:uncharacterized lipoprotein YmbA
MTFARRLFASLILVCLTSCATSPENRYYLLTPAQNADASLDRGSGTAPEISVTVPAYLDRAQIVFVSSDGEADIHEFERWAEPIDGMIARILAQDIEAQAPQRTGHRTLAVVIDSFELGNDRVTLKAHWAATDKNGSTRIQHDFAATAVPTSSSMTGYIATMSDLLSQLAQKIST